MVIVKPKVPAPRSFPVVILYSLNNYSLSPNEKDIVIFMV